MNTREHSDELVDLGAASVETQGPGGSRYDLVDYQKIAGLSDD